MSDSGPPTADETGLDAETQRRVVRERYARIATGSTREGDGNGGGDGDDEGECDDESECCATDSCCGDTPSTETAELIGYTAEDLDGVAGEANLGLGCGNPKALAALSPGETVLDLGSGAGFDCFLAAQEVGEDGRVVGVDMTPEMVEKARANAAENDTDRVEFRLGEIEHLPVADDSIDVVISNCVVNLSPEKPQVFREAFRVLRPGGRLAISDVVMTADVPGAIRADPDSVASCVAGAATIDRLQELLGAVGFERIDISPNDDCERFIREWDDAYDVSEFLVSASISGRKPA